MSWPKRFQLYDINARHRNEPTGLVSDFQRFSIHDGPGIRTLVFLKGCPLHCIWCQNPETMTPNPEIMLIANNCIGCGDCAEACPGDYIMHGSAGRISDIDRDGCVLPECDRCQKVCYANAISICGRYMSVSEVMEVVERDRQFYERTGGGVTISGGEPLAQPRFLKELLRSAKARKLHTAIETSGYANWETLRSVLKFIDLLLYDLKHMDSERHSRLTGVPNHLILDNLRRIDASGIPIRMRLPLVPGLNDSEENVRATADFASALSHLKALDILPYHRMGEPKWRQLDQSYALHGVCPPDREDVHALAEIAREYDIEVTVGG